MFFSTFSRLIKQIKIQTAVQTYGTNVQMYGTNVRYKCGTNLLCLRAVDARFRGKFSRYKCCFNKENETASLGIYGLISYGEPFKERRVHDWASIELF